MTSYKNRLIPVKVDGTLNFLFSTSPLPHSWCEPMRTFDFAYVPVKRVIQKINQCCQFLIESFDERFDVLTVMLSAMLHKSV